jgi:hypothetical protein
MDGIDGLAVSDPVTAEQMRALFGCNPPAELRQQLEGPDLTTLDFPNVARLGAPFKVVDNDLIPFGSRLPSASLLVVTREFSTSDGILTEHDLERASLPRLAPSVRRPIFHPSCPQHCGTLREAILRFRSQRSGVRGWLVASAVRREGQRESRV